jgi:hypothetical protein
MFLFLIYLFFKIPTPSKVNINTESKNKNITLAIFGNVRRIFRIIRRIYWQKDCQKFD